MNLFRRVFRFLLFILDSLIYKEPIELLQGATFNIYIDICGFIENTLRFLTGSSGRTATTVFLKNFILKVIFYESFPRE